MEAPLGVTLSQSMDSVNTNNGEEEVSLTLFLVTPRRRFPFIQMLFSPPALDRLRYEETL